MVPFPSLHFILSLSSHSLNHLQPHTHSLSWYVCTYPSFILLLFHSLTLSFISLSFFFLLPSILSSPFGSLWICFASQISFLFFVLLYFLFFIGFIHCVDFMPSKTCSGKCDR
ncbi:hypothetical protein RIF29_36578 [Crotalaria pallida]|uniref:Uncharacterized protein n=1 Tax=Crotalaria pallida TaxID=3830 RepID=A0AAN9EB91_CROPI